MAEPQPARQEGVEKDWEVPGKGAVEGQVHGIEPGKSAETK